MTLSPNYSYNFYSAGVDYPFPVTGTKHRVVLTYRSRRPGESREMLSAIDIDASADLYRVFIARLINPRTRPASSYLKAATSGERAIDFHGVFLYFGPSMFSISLEMVDWTLQAIQAAAQDTFILKQPFLEEAYITIKIDGQTRGMIGMRKGEPIPAGSEVILDAAVAQ